MSSVFKQKYTAVGTNGKRIRKQSRFWYVDYKTADGTRKRVKGFKDKSATQQLASQLERDAKLARVGLIDKFADHRRRPLADHLADYKICLASKGVTSNHSETTHNRIKAILDSCKFIFMNDISASRVLNYLAEHRMAGLSIKSSNDYLQAVKQFCKWLTVDRRMAESPVAHLQGLNVRTDRRHDRRALEVEELRLLLDVTSTL